MIAFFMNSSEIIKAMFIHYRTIWLIIEPAKMNFLIAWTIFIVDIRNLFTTFTIFYFRFKVSVSIFLRTLYFYIFLNFVFTSFVMFWYAVFLWKKLIWRILWISSISSRNEPFNYPFVFTIFMDYKFSLEMAELELRIKETRNPKSWAI